MKHKILFILGLCASISTNAFAETENKISSDEKADVIIRSEDKEFLELDSIKYEHKNEMNADFFIGLELPIFTYNFMKINNSYFSIRTNELIFNKDVLDNTSLLFGVDVNNTVRIAFNLASYDYKTDDDDGDGDTNNSIGIYGITLDGFLAKGKRLSPFFRFGVGYLKLEEYDVDFSTALFDVGAGINFNLSDNFFSYAVLEYRFIPETEIDDTEINIKSSSMGFSIGLGYKF